ncbi:MAG: hypothetical protein B6U94_03955 [Thermofilum sp. ex4484_79]|nr:MAG: hypothetical protein B6U94_03955 [Thermofilum sp. ex4484_79]
MVKESILPEPYRFVFGEVKTNWVVLDGDGEATYTCDSISVVYEDKKVDLPSDILVLRERIAKEEFEKALRGERYYWNGPSFCIKKVTIGRRGRNLTLSLLLGLSDYYTFLATQMMLDVDISDIPPDPLKTSNPFGRTLRERYLVDVDWRKPNVYLANAFAIGILLVTSDDMAVFTQRSELVGPRKNYFDCSFSEGFHPISDMENGRHNIYRCIARGAFEEMGVRPQYDNIVLLNFGVDTKYYIYAVQGYARVDVTSKEFLEYRALRAEDGWEAKQVFLVPFEVKEILKFMYKHGPWASPTLANIYYVLVNNFGYDKVDSILKNLPRFYNYRD